MTSHFTSLLILVTADIRYQQAYIDCRRRPSVAFEIQVDLAGSAPIIINRVGIVAIFADLPETVAAFHRAN